MERRRKAGVALNQEKSVLGTSETFLGYTISSDEITADCKKVDKIWNMQPPSGIPGVSGIARAEPHFDVRPILGEENKTPTGSAEENVAFQEVKAMVCSATCRAEYHPENPTLVSLDASSHGLGAVLLEVLRVGPSGER